MLPRDAAHILPARAGSYPVRPGNAVRPLVDGEPAFRRICEAVEVAESSVWVTVAFLDSAFAMPDEQGSFFDLLDRAAARDIDVRVVFWNEPEIEKQVTGAEHFPASPDNHAFLRRRGSRIRVRWDRVADHCHHQKSWLIDAGQSGEVAFVGGINLDLGSVSPPGHPRDPRHKVGGSIHDLYLELRGPAATDVAHNFAQRWNEASERSARHGCYPDPGSCDDLSFPESVSPEAGHVPVQITRSVLPGLYADSRAAPGSAPHAIAEGEFSIAEQYRNAIEAAQSSIYLENQLLFCQQTIAQLRGALERGVSVVVLLPAEAMPEIRAVRKHPGAKPFFDLLASLGEFEHFVLAGLAANRGSGEYESIYVHAKFAAVDDCWATIGSANTMFRSFMGDTEMNASFWDRDTVHDLRCELLREHLGEETSHLDDRAAFARYREVAIHNAEQRRKREPMRGQVFAMDPARWAE